VTAVAERQLPAGPKPAPRHSITTATAGVVAAGTMLIFGMLAMWFRFRDAAPLRDSRRGDMIRDWLPADIAVPEVATNTLMITMVVVCVMAQWAAYSAKRGQRQHTTLALAVTMFLGLAAVNAQVAVYIQMGMGILDGPYQSMFYAVTGTVLAILVSGVVFSLVAMFRAVGGRLSDADLFRAHALYWYFIGGAFLALWFVVYVQK
jgi:heme/copper-type cytochrome/quinol oxidase subunit 3